MRTSNDPYPIERILSAATYITAGGAGFIWLIIAAITRKQVRPFLMYHILQSIFISILYTVILYFFDLTSIILLRIPLIKRFADILNNPLFFALDLSILQLFTTIIIFYLIITSFMGYYSYLPFISDVIKGNTRH